MIDKLFYYATEDSMHPCPEYKYAIFDNIDTLSLGADTKFPYNEILYEFKVKEIHNIFKLCYGIQEREFVSCPIGKYSIYDDANIFLLGKDTEFPYTEILYKFRVEGINYDR